MDNKVRKKHLAIISALLHLVASVSAAITEEGGLGGAWSGGLEGIGSIIVGVFGAATWYEISTLPQAVFFIAIWAVLYFFSLKIIDEILWKYISKAIKLGSNDKFGPGLGGSDGPGRSEKGMALAGSFIGAQYFGPLIGSFLGGAFLLFGAMMALAILGVFRLFLSGSGMITGSTNTSSNESSMDNNARDIWKKLKNEQDRIDKTEKEEAESEKTGNVEETQDVAVKFQDIIGNLSDAEKQVDQLLEAEEGDLEQALQEAKEIIQEEKKEENGIQDIEQRYQRIVQATEQIHGYLQQGSAGVRRQGGNISLPEFKGTGSNGQGVGERIIKSGSDFPYGVEGGFANVAQDIQQVEQDLQEIYQLEQTESDEVRDEVQRLIEEAERFQNVNSIIELLESELGEIWQDEEELEKIAKGEGNKQIFEEAEQEEQELKSLKQNLPKLKQLEGRIQEELQKASQMLDEELEMDKEEVKQLKQEIQQTEKMENLLQQLGQDYSYNEPASSDSKGAMELIQEAEQALENIESQMTEIEKIKEKEEQQIAKADRTIKEALG